MEQERTDVPFEAVRGRLFGIAYRMLASRADAEDIVQEAYVRWHQAERDSILNSEAWLVTATTRLAVDRLRVLKTERESYIGPWLPEPLLNRPPAPDYAAELTSDLSIAFLVLLERLGPEERAAFLLHEVFERDYDEIANVLGKSEPACRQMLHRARERVQTDQKRFAATEAAKTRLLQQFVAAVEARDDKALLGLFAADATWTADGGGKTAASPRPILGSERIVNLVLGLQKIFAQNEGSFHLAVVNGEPGLVVRTKGEVSAIIALDDDGEQIRNVYAIVNPDKLSNAQK
jgi:RNA polymerase sigma-70 factor (ECF subfamily)